MRLYHSERPSSLFGSLAIGAILLPAVLLSPWGGTASPAQDVRVLRVGTSADYPPLTFVRGSELAGIEIELANRFAAESGRSVEWVRLPFQSLIPALRDHRIDVVMSGMSITSDRAQRVRFTEPYLQVGQMALIRAAEWRERSDRDALDAPSNRIGFRAGTTGEEFVRSKLKQAEGISFDSIEAGVQALRDHKIDYFIHDAPTIWRIVGGFESDETELTGLYRPLTEEFLGWAVRSGDAPLAAELNAHLAEWKRSGQLDLVLDRWIRTRRITLD